MPSCVPISPGDESPTARASAIARRAVSPSAAWIRARTSIKESSVFIASKSTELPSSRQRVSVAGGPQQAGGEEARSGAPRQEVADAEGGRTDGCCGFGQGDR